MNLVYSKGYKKKKRNHSDSRDLNSWATIFVKITSIILASVLDNENPLSDITNSIFNSVQHDDCFKISENL